jgi:hypothetical protein
VDRWLSGSAPGSEAGSLDLPADWRSGSENWIRLLVPLSLIAAIQLKSLSYFGRLDLAVDLALDPAADPAAR